MLKKRFIKYVYFIHLFTILITLLLLNCRKESNEINSSIIKTSSGIRSIPFFELAKGDTIPKYVFREKPIFKAEEATVIYSTVNDAKLKSTGVSSDFGEGYISNLYLSIRRENTVGDWLWDGLRKIPVDLNEGAGGKWIYLFCSKSLNSDFAYNLRLHFGKNGVVYNGVGEYWVERENGNPGDCNDGAGGEYIYIVRQRNCVLYGKSYVYGPSPIKDIAIVSAPSSDVTLPGWLKIPGDLNKGAGGKYIYLFIKY